MVGRLPPAAEPLLGHPGSSPLGDLFIDQLELLPPRALLEFALDRLAVFHELKTFAAFNQKPFDSRAVQFPTAVEIAAIGQDIDRFLQIPPQQRPIDACLFHTIPEK